MPRSPGQASATPGCAHPRLGPTAKPWATAPSSGQSAPSGQLSPLSSLSSSRSVLIKDLLEDVFEAPVISLEDGVLGAHVERPLLLDGVLEAAVSEARDGLQGKCMDPRGTPVPPAWPRSTWMAGHAASQGPHQLLPSHPVTSSVLYMPMPTPPPGKLYTSHSLAPLPSFGVKTILNVPDLPTTKSVALYCKGNDRASCRVRQELPDIPVPQAAAAWGSPGRHGHACQW